MSDLFFDRQSSTHRMGTAVLLPDRSSGNGDLVNGMATHLASGKRLLDNLKVVNAEVNPELERLALKLATARKDGGHGDAP